MSIPVNPTRKHIIDRLDRISDPKMEYDYKSICTEILDLLLDSIGFATSHWELTTEQMRYIDTNFIKATRELKKFTILDHRNLLYPQYRDRFLDFDKMIESNIEWLIPLAKKELKASGKIHPKIKEHLEKIISMSK